MTAEQNSYTDEKGHAHLVLRGPEGAVTLEAWSVPGSSQVLLDLGLGETGILTIHSLAPQYETHAAPQECPVLGTCYPDTAFRAGHEAGLALLAGNEGYAWAVVREWYHSRLGGEL